MRTTLAVILCVMAVVLSLGGCAPVLVAGTATGVAVAADRRSAGTILDDQNIETHIAYTINQDETIARQTHIVVTCYNHVVLLTGQSPDPALTQKVIDEVRTVGNIKRIHNEIRTSTPTLLKTRSQDTWLTTQIKSRLLADERLSGLQVKVITENSEVFLLGLVKHREADIAVQIAQETEGVSGVYKVFEYLD